MAARLLAGSQTLLLGGPTGIGKSTELANATVRLQQERVACLVCLDRWENMRRVMVDQVLLRIAGQVVTLAVHELHLPVSQQLRQALTAAGVFEEAHSATNISKNPGNTGYQLAQLALTEVAGLAQSPAVTLLIDGLEKLPEGDAALEIFDALGTLPVNTELIVVIPWHAAFGSQAAQLIRPGEHFVAMRAPAVEGVEDTTGRDFLTQIFAARLGLAPTLFEASSPGAAARVAAAFVGKVLLELSQIIKSACRLSGGLPRLFLQLMADAATYARIERSAAWPTERDLANAALDMAGSFKRVLIPGDRAKIRRFAGTDGLELDIPSRVHLLTHGLLLERVKDGETTLLPHPLLRAALSEGPS